MLLAGKKGLVFSVTNKHSIGWAIAKAAADHGAHVGIGAQNERTLESVEKLIAGDSRFTPIVVDFTNDEQMEALPQQVESKIGPVDFLVHSAAYAPKADLEGRFIETSKEGFQIALEVSAYSLIHLCRVLEPLLKDDSSVMCLSYLGSTRAAGTYRVMGVAKAALESCVRYLAADLGPRGIRVNTISPGPINTVAARGVKNFLPMIETVKANAPLKRPFEQEQVASTAVYLMSDLSHAVTGQIIFVDSGFNIVGVG